jgi:LysR family transcriptional regulator of abg operon
MKLGQIRDVIAIVERGTLRSAAQWLGLAQPALSRSVRELEHELGVDLFERHAGGMKLTVFGEAFIRRARLAQSELQRSRDEIDQLKGLTTGQVTVGLSTVASIALLPNVLNPFRGRFPGVRLKVLEGSFPAQRRPILEGGLDFYVGPVVDQPIPRELGLERLFENERIVLGRIGHPMHGARTLAGLVDARWVGTTISEHREDELGPVFRQYRLEAPTIEVETSSALNAITIAGHTDLLAMLPRQYLRDPSARHLLARIDVAERLVAPDIYLVHRAGLPLTPAAEFLSDLFRRAAIAEQET